MSSTQQQHVLLSPAELAYLHSALSQTPPIRPDGRRARQFRDLSAEIDILPGTNGSARVCFADGTEAVVGVKAEIEKTPARPAWEVNQSDGDGDGDGNDDGADACGSDDWVELSVEIPGARDDDSGTAFLASTLSEALLADEEFTKKLFINRRFHWKLYLDVRLLP